MTSIQSCFFNGSLSKASPFCKVTFLQFATHLGMRFLNHTLICLCLAFVTGVYVGFYDVAGIRHSFWILILLAIVLLLAKHLVKFKPLVFGIALILFFWLGCLNTLVHLPKHDERHLMHLAFDGNNLQDIKAEVVEVLKDNEYNYKYILEELIVDSIPYNAKVLLHINKSGTTRPLEVGDQLQLFSSLKPIQASRNPQDFNYAKYLKNKNVYAQIYEDSYLVTGKNSNSPVAIAYKLRNGIVENLKRSGFKTKHLQLLQALILGQKQHIDEHMYTQFADVGIVHILAVSGLHVGLIFLTLSHLLKPLLVLKQGIWLRALFVVILLWAFAFLVGLSPSVVRAVTMFSCFALSDLYQRRTNSINVLLLSALILLLFKPQLLFEVGFQLSYAAVFSIVCLYPVFSKLYAPKYKLVKVFSDTLFVSLAAQIGVLPFQLLYFHQFPTLFLLGNIVVIPFLGVLISGGLVCIVLSAMNMLWHPVLWVYSKLLEGLIWYVDWLSNFKGVVLKDIYFTKPMCVGLVLLLLAFIFMMRNFKRNEVLVFLFCGIIFATVVGIESLNTKENAELVIFHKYRSSLFGFKHQEKLIVFTSDTTTGIHSYTIQNYKLLNAVKAVEIQQMKNELVFGDTRLSVIDSLGVYRDSPEPRIVVLCHSPDIHFEKLLKTQNITRVIADGSNYKSYRERWQNTAAQYDIPFHSTYQKGHYILKPD